MSSLRFRSAGARVDLDGADGRLGELVRAVAAPMITDDDSPAQARVTVPCAQQGRVGRGHAAAPGAPAELDRLAAAVIASVDRALLAASPCLHVHAVSVAGSRGAVLVPGVSGFGKSTLAAAAMQAGLRLVSDEAACLDPVADVVWPHPRPLGLSAHSRRLLGLADPPGSPPEEERATAPDLFGRSAATDEPVPVVLVVVGSRRAGGADLVPSSAAEGLGVLLANCLNTGAGAAWSPEAAWRRLGRLAQSVSVVRLSFDRPQDGALLLAQWLSDQGQAATPVTCWAGRGRDSAIRLLATVPDPGRSGRRQRREP